MTFQGFGFPNQNISCLANSTLSFLRASWQALPLFSAGNGERVHQPALLDLQLGLTPDASLSPSEVPSVLTEQIACSRRPGLSSAPPGDQKIVRSGY